MIRLGSLQKKRKRKRRNPKKEVGYLSPSAADREQLLEVGKVPPLTYGDDIDFDKILQEGDEFIFI